MERGEIMEKVGMFRTVGGREPRAAMEVKTVICVIAVHVRQTYL